MMPAALCEHCEWSKETRSLEYAVMIKVLHMLVKHPDEYRAETGKDPEVAKFMYRDQIRSCQKDL